MISKMTQDHLENGIAFIFILVKFSLLLVYKGKSKSYCTKHKLFCPWGEFFNINIQYEVVEKTEGIATFEKMGDSANMGE